MVGLLTPLISLATTWFDGQQKKSEAKVQAEVALKQAEAEVFKRKATSEADWDLEAMRGSQGSWKDEVLLVVFLVPFLASFIGPLQPYVVAGFGILADTPEWYRYSLGVMVAASFGVRNFMKVMKR
jgi:hypothetical protein